MFDNKSEFSELLTGLIDTDHPVYIKLIDTEIFENMIDVLEGKGDCFDELNALVDIIVNNIKMKVTFGDAKKDEIFRDHYKKIEKFYWKWGTTDLYKGLGRELHEAILKRETLLKS